MFKTHSHRTMDMTEGPILTKVLFFSLPIMLSGILQLLFNAADTIVVGRFAGRQALAAFRDSEPGSFDAILMDVMMPEMDGLEAAQAIRALDRPDAKTIPIIAMTANVFKEDREKCLAAGMNAHLSKPLDAETMKRTISEQLKKLN